MDRPREYQEGERRWRREEEKTRYYRNHGRGTTIMEGSLSSLLHSPLANTMKKICEEELRGTNISMSVQERGGRRLGQELEVTVPGRSSKEHCKRDKCFPCHSGMEGVCRKMGVGYQMN